MPFEAPTGDAVAGAFERRLAKLSPTRTRNGRWRSPGRIATISRWSSTGSSLSAYGSQGQQRTAVLALKVAEYSVMRDRANEAPLLLLDDVLSELDQERAAAFLAGVGGYEQAFVTATHLPPELPEAVAIYRIEQAAVTRC